MTRKEEIELAWIKKADTSNHKYDEKSFKEAVEWADKTMLDRACEWLENYMYYHDCGDYDVVSSSSDTIEEMIDNFKKAMEE